MSYVLLGCRCLLALVFLFSVAGRLRGRKPYDEFVATARRLTPDWMTSRIPVVVPAGLIACELTVPVLLIMPSTMLPGFALAAVLAAGYALAIGGTLRPAAGDPAARPAAGPVRGDRLPAGPGDLPGLSQAFGRDGGRLDVSDMGARRANDGTPADLTAAEILAVFRLMGANGPAAGTTGHPAGYRLHRGHVIRHILLSGIAVLGLLSAVTAAGPVDIDTAIGVVIASGIVAMLIVAADRVVDLLRPLT